MTEPKRRTDSERRSIAAYALATMRAEGLEPTDEAKQDAAQYERGEITAAELEARADARIREFVERRRQQP